MLEEEISADPFAKLAPPNVASEPTAAIPDDALGRLRAVCKGTGLNALRDTAIITVLIDTGMRPLEVSGLNYAVSALDGDVDFDYNVLRATDAR